MKEQEIYTFWEQDADRVNSLETNRGESINVIGSGKQNTGSGPDYTGCILEIDGEIWTGEVEIHVDEEDWLKHGHHQDESFDHVQLHFFLHASSREIAADQVRRTVEVDPVRLGKQEHQPMKSDASTCTTLCPAGSKLQLSPEHVSDTLEVIERMGWERIQRRKQKVRSSWTSSRRLKSLCKLLSSSLGLHANRQPAGCVIESVDLRWLRKRLRSIEDPAQSQLFGEGVLLSRAGLIDGDAAFEGHRTSGGWEMYKAKLDEQIPELPTVQKKLAWEVSDVRPVNTPFRRMAGFVALFRRFFVRFSVDQVETFLTNRIRQTREQNHDLDHASGLIRLLTVKPEHVSSYWNDHSHPHKSLSQEMALIGSHRAAILWINGLLPYLLVMAEQQNRTELQTDLRELMHIASLPLGDQRTRTVKQQLFGSGSETVPQTGAADQGMHELFSSYCRYGPAGCSRCPVHERVKG